MVAHIYIGAVTARGCRSERSYEVGVHEYESRRYHMKETSLNDFKSLNNFNSIQFNSI